MKDLPFSENTIKELMKNGNLTRYELLKDYNKHLDSNELHDNEFSEDWTKEQ